MVYVIDTGFIKQNHFHPESGIQSLDVVNHSQAGCEQRAGRAGRTQPGVCFRLFMQEDFEKRPRFTEPEIKRMSLAGVVLQMKSIGIKDIENFDFIDPPEKEAWLEAYQTLIALGAITGKNNGLTTLGEKMAHLPLEPRIARMVLEADKYSCIKEVATVAAFLSVRDVFVRPKDKTLEADFAHTKFKISTSDALTFLKIWEEYKESGFSQDWCFENFLHSRTLWEVKKIREQLLEILYRQGMNISSSDDEELVLRSVTAGLIHNLITHGSRHSYYGVVRNELYNVFIHPGSSVFGGASPRWVVATEMVQTSKLFARKCSSVDPGWLPEFLPNKFSFGEVKLLSYTPGEDKVNVKRKIIDREGGSISAGWQEVAIPIEEARRLYEDQVEHAKANGWIPLSFKEGEEFMTKVAHANGHSYKLYWSSEFSPAEDETYYCQVHEDSILGWKADPQFKALDLGSDEQNQDTEPARTTDIDRLKAWANGD